ncbi:hypothetical protein [Actinomadura sp. DC4]|uniref:hypothetical protein n=1 Tax=Actinomadura sp. DC4 TaxID=3055069 RepID=UPI0025B1FA74|nr:hypothetical protein [Actinomadura sp. DC4]MDN3356697.1 hypothetical protein [Actinomadura sp. DC4]
MNLTKVSYLAAPALMGAYGVVRLMGGQHGPGFGWTFGHSLMLAGLVLFAWVIAGLRRLAPPGLAANALAAIGAVGLVATCVQFGIDIVVGLLSEDAAAKHHYSERIQGVPGLTPLVYTVVPVFFYVGVLGLLVLLATARARIAPWWAPVLILAGTATVAADLDYIPESAVLFLLGLAPFAFQNRNVMTTG